MSSPPYPSSLAFITSGSRGNRLLFYTRGSKSDQGGRKDVIHELPPTTLAEILAPSSLMLGHKFELSVDEWKFIGHPFSVQRDTFDIATFDIAFNVVFIFQSFCTPEVIRAYDHLSHMIGSAIVHEEKRCGYLRNQVSELMQLLEDADIPDPSSEVIVELSSLANSLHSILCSLQKGKKHIQVRLNSWSEVNTLLEIGSSNSNVSSTPPPSHQLCVRSYSALLLFEGAESLLNSLSRMASPAVHRLVQAFSPMKSLQAVSLDADIPLLQTLQVASHLVTWGRGMAIYPLSESNMYITSATCNTRVDSKLAQQFRDAFPSPAPSLPEVLSHFSLPISLGDLKDSIPDERIIEMTVWLLQHRQIIQLHTYVYIVPTTAVPTTSYAEEGSSHGHTPNTKSADSGMQADKHVGVAKGAELLSHLTAEERHSVLGTAAAQDTEDLEQFAKLSQYFHGDHHLEGIMLMENIPRSQLLTLIDKFSEVLVTCTLPEHSMDRSAQHS